MFLCFCATAQAADFSFCGSAKETTAALQSAIDAGGVVCVKPGDYEIMIGPNSRDTKEPVILTVK